MGESSMNGERGIYQLPKAVIIYINNVCIWACTRVGVPALGEAQAISMPVRRIPVYA